MGFAMARSTFTILLGGALSLTDRLAHQLAASRFIAADGGMRHARLLGIVPDVWVGDFDSTEEALLADYASVPREPYPVAKAATDGEIAVEAGDLPAGDPLRVPGLDGARREHRQPALRAADPTRAGRPGAGRSSRLLGSAVLGLDVGEHRAPGLGGRDAAVVLGDAAALHELIEL